MNILRFRGKDNKSALDQVRQQLGPDALILSSKRTELGVEICATVALPDLTNVSDVQLERPYSGNGATPVQQSGNEFQLAQLKRELSSLRSTLQAALGERRWQDTAAQKPINATIAQRLVTLGVGRRLAGELSDLASPRASLENAWAQVLEVLNQKMTALSQAEVEGFRVKVVVGGSGVGKTRTAVAMLAGALRDHKPEQVAVITCGDPRDQTLLTRAAQTLNIKAYSATNSETLSGALAACRWAREIIIDTPGLNLNRGPEDPVLHLLRGLRTGAGIFLAIPANGQSGHLHALAEHVKGLPIAGAVMTKIDEAVLLGGIIDVVVDMQLPLAGRITPDKDTLVPVSARELLTNAKRLAKRTIQRRASQLKVAV